MVTFNTVERKQHRLADGLGEDTIGGPSSELSMTRGLFCGEGEDGTEPYKPATFPFRAPFWPLYLAWLCMLYLPVQAQAPTLHFLRYCLPPVSLNGIAL